MKKTSIKELKTLIKNIIKEEFVNKEIINEDLHLVNDLYSSDLIGKEMYFGSPGFPMIFIPREIKQIDKETFEFTGDMPDATNGTEGHFFLIGEDELEEMENTGETFWIAKDGAHQYLANPS